MRLRRLLVGAATTVLAAGGLGLVGPPAAEASCVGAQLSVTQPGIVVTPLPRDEKEETVYPVSRAKSLQVAASNLVDGCRDTYAGSPGCGRATPPPVEPIRPLADLRLVLRQGTNRWTLAQADGPAADLTASFSVRLPARARAGPALLELSSKKGGVVGALQFQLS